MEPAPAGAVLTMALSASDRRFRDQLKERDRLLAEINRRRREDWEMTVAGYAVLASRRVEPDPAPRANGFTPRRPAPRLTLSRPRPRREPVQDRDAEAEAALEASLKRLQAQGIYTGPRGG